MKHVAETGENYSLGELTLRLLRKRLKLHKNNG